MSEPHRLNLTASAASIATAVALLGVKAWAAWATGALSVAASLVDSALDLTIALANLAALIYAARPADADHRFGHSSAEDIAAFVQSLVVAGAGAMILAAAVARLREPRPLASEVEGLIAMGASLALTLALVWFQRRVARRTGSKIVAADRAHYLSDIAPNLAAMAALGVSAVWDRPEADSVLAIAAALWIFRIAWGVGSNAVDALMDREAPEDLTARIAALAADTPGARGFHDLRTRMSGARLFVQLHLEIDRAAPLHEAHRIGEGLRRRILALGRDVDVTIHHDPV